ncbi:hypothetical protein Tel_09610 [Candidatus Tenderia electrophaga]|uniref:Peptidase n=1 Tax=Candidatus Tenderia electrophaga TaxID=1748243 RepID=A0A0S2TE20_9GAMM|nr:hypothetical protein Tel_09610 [Candidatus Tenderia electrophaga]
MSAFIAEYGLFLAKTVTIVIAIIAIVAAIILLASRGREGAREHLEVKKLNDKYEQMAHTIEASTLDKFQLKKRLKHEKKQLKDRTKRLKRGNAEPRQRVFVLNFDGDIRATQLASLREEISAILSVATPADEVLLKLQSGGGLVHAYGLAASQLMRLKQKDIPLIVSVDKIAASGGYMMACVADKIIAAPFSVIGSIGVIAQIPNFHRLLKKHDIEFEQLTAGEFKRTLTMFGENTDKARQKFKEELEDTHSLFKDFIAEQRSSVDVDRIATGEHWPAKRALEMSLVDELKTSDDYLLEQINAKDVYALSYSIKKPLGVRMGWFIQSTLEKLLQDKSLP